METENLKIAPLPSASWRELTLWLLRRRFRLRVTGDSMMPTLKADDIVLVDKQAYANTLPLSGEIVVAHHPYHKKLLIIKRVTDITVEKRIQLESDNPQAGSDSRQFGTVALAKLVGRVTCQISR